MRKTTSRKKAPTTRGQKPQQPLWAIMNWGPQSTTAGEPFNIQPSGKCAMFFLMPDPPPLAAVFWQGKALPGVIVDAAAGLITAEIPSDCFAASGVYDILIKDLESGASSQVVQFLVR